MGNYERIEKRLSDPWRNEDEDFNRGNDPKKAFKFDKAYLREVLELLASGRWSVSAYREEVKETLFELMESEGRVGEVDPAMLPDAESEGLKKRAAKLLAETRLEKSIADEVPMTVTVSRLLWGNLRVIGNTLAARIGLPKEDTISPEETLQILADAYCFGTNHESEDFTLPFSELKRLAKAVSEKPPHVLTPEQRAEIDKLVIDEGLSFKEARAKYFEKKNG